MYKFLTVVLPCALATSFKVMQAAAGNETEIAVPESQRNELIDLNVQLREFIQGDLYYERDFQSWIREESLQLKILSEDAKRIKFIGHRLYDLGEKEPAQRIMIWQEECDRFLYYLDQVITAIPNLLDPETLAFFKEFVPIVDEDLNPINLEDLTEE